jgi:hypothetical protein
MVVQFYHDIALIVHALAAPPPLPLHLSSILLLLGVLAETLALDIALVAMLPLLLADYCYPSSCFLPCSCCSGSILPLLPLAWVLR